MLHVSYPAWVAAAAVSEWAPRPDAAKDAGKLSKVKREQLEQAIREADEATGKMLTRFKSYFKRLDKNALVELRSTVPSLEDHIVRGMRHYDHIEMFTSMAMA